VRPLLLLSVLIGTFVLPAVWLRRQQPIAFLPMWRTTAALVLLYIGALLFVFPRLP